MILGFELEKINVERKGRPMGNVKVKHNLNIDSVTERTLTALGKRKSLDIRFTFTVSYEPSLGNITIIGNVLYSDNDAKLANVMEHWKSKKKVIREASIEVVNSILARCNIKSLQLAEDLNLPYHMPLPKFESPKSAYENYIG